MNLIGQILQDRYYIVSVIGEGGMGRVYEAEDTRLNQKVAIKETITNSFESSEETTARIRAFQREALLLAGKIKHPAIPKVIDYFQFGQNWYIVMEYIDGDNLEKQRKDRKEPFSIKEVLLIADQLLQILDLLHNQEPPIIHRDIKPSNIKVKDNFVYLLDFGLAKQIKGSNSTFSAFMTPAFASPEQINNNKEITIKSDLYSAAATIYYLLTNKEPASAFERSVAIASGSQDSLENINKIRPDIPDEITHIVMSALSIRAEDRPHNAKTMQLKIKDLLNEKDKTLPLLSVLPPTQSFVSDSTPKLNQLDASSQNEKMFVGSKQNINADLFFSNESSESFYSSPGFIKLETAVPEASKNNTPAISLASNLASIKPAGKAKSFSWQKTALLLIILLVVGIGFFSIFQFKDQLIAHISPTPTPIPSPTVNPRDISAQLTDEAVESFFNNRFGEAKEKAKKAIDADDSYAFAYAVYGESIRLDTIVKSKAGSADNDSIRNKLVISNQNDVEISNSKLQVQKLVQAPQTAEENVALAWWFSFADPQESIKYSDKAIQMKENFASAWYQKVTSTDRTKDAITLWDKLINLKPNFAIAHLEIARLYEEDEKNYDKVINAYNKAINVWKPSPIPHIDKGDFFFRRKKYKEAINEYNLAIEKDAKNVYAFYSIALIHEEQKNYELCVESLNIIIGNEMNAKTSARLYNQRSSCYEEQIKDDTKFEEMAIKDIEEAIKLDEKNYFYHYQKARLLNNAGAFYWDTKGQEKKAMEKFKSAREVLKVALESDPKNTDYQELKKKIDSNLKLK